MIQICWMVSGEANMMREIFQDRYADTAQARYEELVSHQRCFDIRMSLVDETDAVMLEAAK